MMSITKKRALSQDLESGDAKRLVAPSSRPPKPPTKRRKTEESPGSSKCNYSGGDQRVISKGKRQAWTATAIEAFFEGLYQHGKHFHRILKHMQNKQKKLNDPLIPNLTKDQVRFFYYRTWHKVESRLDPSLQTVCDPAKKTKQSQSSSDSASVHTAAAVADEGENHIDTSIEEDDVADLASPKKATEVLHNGGVVGDLASLSPTNLESSDKIKEQVGASPSSSSDKSESKVKDVVVNGVKQSLDLVALICYHKLKQKCQLDHNFWKRLSELVYQGTTTIPSRVKGKRRIQIKVPNCGALRGKLRLPLMSEDPVVERMEENPIVGDCDDTTEQTAEQGTSDRGLLDSDAYLSSDEPTQITLELRPLTNASWAHVQGLSQNPRLRITMGASRRLVELLQILSHRWKIDKATINIYHTYTKCVKQTTVASKCPMDEKKSSFRRESSVPKSSTLPSNPCDEVQVDRINTEQVQASDLGSVKGVGEAGVSDGLQQHLNVATHLAMLEDKSTWQLEYNSQTSMKDIHRHFCQPECVQLLYSIPHVESKDTCSVDDKLKILLKIVELIIKGSDMDDHSLVQTTKTSHTPKKVINIIRRSPKLVEYMKSLEKRSPRKSPLAKYQRLRVRSPYRVPLNQLKPKRVQLDFSTSTSATAATPSASVLSTMTIGKASPEVIQLSKPSLPLKSAALEETQTKMPYSFTTVKLHNVLSQVTDSTNQSLKDNSSSAKLCGQQALSETMTSPSTSVAEQSKQLIPPLQLSAGTSKRQPLVTQVSQDIVHSPVISMSNLKPLTSSSYQSAPITAIALQPGHHFLKPRQSVLQHGVTVTPITSSVVMSTSPSGLYQSPIADTHNSQVVSSQQSSTSSVPFVSSLKPFSKPRRIKKSINRTGQTRQLIPRPLPFLPQPQASSVEPQSRHDLLPTLPTLPSSEVGQVPVKDGTVVSQNQNTLVLTLLQAVMQQQRQLKQQLKISSDSAAASTSQLTRSVTTIPCESESEAFLEEDAIPDGLNNLLEFEKAATDSQGKVFNTSSDTVNNLLRGLSCTKENESIKKLTEETANVLPTFAKVLGQSTQPPSEPSSFETLPQVDEDEFKVCTSVQPSSPEGIQNELSSVSMSELLGNLSDSTFKQISERDEVLENVNFSDVFSQLREVLKSPEKLETDQEGITSHQSKDQSDESMSSIGCLLDYLNSGEEVASSSSDGGTKRTGASQMGDPTYSSLMEESSVDYIQKFKELASSMDKEGI